MFHKSIGLKYNGYCCSVPLEHCAKHCSLANHPVPATVDTRNPTVPYHSGGCDKQVKMWPLGGGQPETDAIHHMAVSQVSWISKMNMLDSEKWDKILRLAKLLIDNGRSECMFPTAGSYGHIALEGENKEVKQEKNGVYGKVKLVSERYTHAVCGSVMNVPGVDLLLVSC
ncbi:Protein RAE1 [Artemisia annua]|uniref:Protein RAE1 n=1 Tax=Artemisia annua TaxID=35608 RepID=A0A2U1NTQ7_ARTAN|nr:Protein RAE1 [Artemisia annua]